MSEIKPADALAAAASLLQRFPENIDALYIDAVSRRLMKQPHQAMQTLDRLEALAPSYGRLHQERGFCYLDMGLPVKATFAFERGISLNPALPASWEALIALYTASGRSPDVAVATTNAQYLNQLPAQLVSAASQINEGALYKAEQLCRQYLQMHGHHIEAMRLLADIGVRLNVLDDADFLLESCVSLMPQHHAARYDWANVLHRRQKYAQAYEQAQILRSAEPGHRRFEVLYANQCVALGKYSIALSIYEAMLKGVPDDPQMYLACGNTLKMMGRGQEAIGAYRNACRAKPSFGEAYWSLSNLKTYRFTSEELKAMKKQHEFAALPDYDRYHFCFALGKAYEDSGEFEKSFSYYDCGNRLKRKERRYVPKFMERDLRLQQAVCTAELFSKFSGAGCPKRGPIFVVGLPRSGSTLVEQILSSHSQVEGTQELPFIASFAHSLDRRRRIDEEPTYPGSLEQLTGQNLTSLGEKYLADSLVYRNGKPFFVDKMPNNFRHLGLISLILPNAKIIDVRREPMACCFSGFKQLFVEGQEFTYDLADLGRYYRSYVSLMQHWEAVLPTKIFQLRYEDIVDDLESSVRGLLEFCELRFEAQCVEFHKTNRTPKTASSEQVRLPIFRDALNRWRDYEAFLGPLRLALGPLVADP